jgi:D-alanyl-D-alanine carboxypeptidase
MKSALLPQVSVLAGCLTLATLAYAQRVAPDTTAKGPVIKHVSVNVTDDGVEKHCREQKAQSFLIRSNWFPGGSAEAQKAGKELFQKSLNYRTEKYGYFPGFGDKSLNSKAPSSYAKPVTFMGMTLTVNEHVGKALRCVEAALKASGHDADYKPNVAGGIRFKNTYRGMEISNHVYGIALDIEPHRNTCCSCVDPWPNHPLCKKNVSSIYERMAMPRSWVVIFERYGFYWLGHDALQDTMHFEFLGAPEKIFREAKASPDAPATDDEVVEDFMK